MDEKRYERWIMSRAAHWLMRHTIADLRARSASADEYELLGIAGVLRRTLIDQHLLIDVGRRKDVPRPVFQFRPNVDIRKPQNPSFTTVVYLLDPGEFREPIEQANLNDFLSASLGSIDGRSLTVRSLIHHFAHVEGGVHLGLAKSDESRALRDVFFFRGDAWRHGLALLADVAAVTAGALETLAEHPDSPPY